MRAGRRSLLTTRSWSPNSPSERYPATTVANQYEGMAVPRSLVTPANVPWKADDWNHPSAWNQPIHPRTD